MKKKSEKWVKFRHKVILAILRYPVQLAFFLLFGFRPNKVKFKKDENAFIISNHQSDYDPIFISLSLNKPIYYVGTDTLFNKSFVSKLLRYAFAPIPKKKAISDPKCIKSMFKVAKEKGSIGLFAEGNRTYAEFQYHIDISLAKLIKTTKLPLILFNIHGGTGCCPRFANKKRKGKFYTKLAKRVEYSEYSKLSDQELLDLIKENIKVYDSENNYSYKSKRRAEYLERMLFVCPKCNKSHTLYSKNEFVYCNECGLKVEYTEKLHLKSEDTSFKFDRLIDWYEYQKKWCREYDYSDNEKIIFIDNDIKLFHQRVGEKRKLIFKGTLTLTANKLTIAGCEINVKDIIIASVIGGRKFNFSTNDQDYLIIGHKKFNPLKYVMMFNRLDTHMKEKEMDKYFNIN